MTDARYPIGKFQRKETLTADERSAMIDAIAEAPARVAAAVKGLTDRQLDTPYREGGWTVRQVVHHLPDSHLNAYVRIKLALTEEHPTVKTYEEARWAELHDATTLPPGPSLELLSALHQRWVSCLRSLKPEDFGKTFNHPDSGTVNIDWLVQLYSWHGRHHVAQIMALRQRMGW